MSKDKIVVLERENGYYRLQYRLQWYIAEDDDYGLTIGEEKFSAKPPENREEYETWVAHKVCNELKQLGDAQKDRDGFFWESKADANYALRTVNLELKQERPLPEWAKMAIKNGWKAPKGWKA